MVALDWVEVRAFHTLVAAVPDGRSVPLLWASYPEWELHRNQNNVAEGLIRLLLLADRGFGRAEFARTFVGMINVSFVLRIKPQVVVRHPRFTGQLVAYPVQKGRRRVLRGARFRASDPLTVTGVVRWKKGLPEHQDEPWFLITDLSKPSAVQVTE